MKRPRSSLAIATAAITLLAGSIPATAQGGMGFDVNVTLSQKAGAKLAAEKEGIVVFVAIQRATPRSMPTRSAKSASNSTPRKWRYREQVPRRISGAKVDTKRLDWLAGPAKGTCLAHDRQHLSNFKVATQLTERGQFMQTC